MRPENVSLVQGKNVKLNKETEEYINIDSSVFLKIIKILFLLIQRPTTLGRTVKIFLNNLTISF